MKCLMHKTLCNLDQFNFEESEVDRLDPEDPLYNPKVSECLDRLVEVAHNGEHHFNDFHRRLQDFATKYRSSIPWLSQEH